MKYCILLFYISYKKNIYIYIYIYMAPPKINSWLRYWLSIWRVPSILYFCFYYIILFLLNFVILNLDWSVCTSFGMQRTYFLDECYIFVDLYYFECGLKTWSICTTFWDVKKIISRWMLYLILCMLKWVVLHSCQLNTTHLLSVSNGLSQVNPLN